MSPKVVLGLALVTVLTVVVAVVVVLSEPGTGRIEFDDRPAFPELRADPDAVGEIVIETADQEVRLRRQDEGGWIAETAYGYPASSGRIRGLVTALADMRLIEPKTANPERFGRLQVEDVEREGATSRLVRLADGDGGVLADVLIGKARNRLTGTEPAGTYIRFADEEQSWLASGRIELPAEPALWLERRVVDLAGDEVVSISVEPPDGEAYTLAREDEGWILDDGSAEMAGDQDPGELSGALEALEHQGVRPAAEVAWPEVAWRFRFTTEKGLEVAVRLAEVEGEPWAQLEASTNLTDDGQEAVERAAAISARTEGWAYRLPDPLSQRLRQPRSAWLDDGTS
ncbi:MAG: DUF4340 domain-containing protein [Geminicoccaceae bacterium]|nr:DUF4340 domain-containing protein [Geminicoccaceae bacterium]